MGGAPSSSRLSARSRRPTSISKRNRAVGITAGRFSPAAAGTIRPPAFWPVRWPVWRTLPAAAPLSWGLPTTVPGSAPGWSPNGSAIEMGTHRAEVDRRGQGRGSGFGGRPEGCVFSPLPKTLNTTGGSACGGFDDSAARRGDGNPICQHTPGCCGPQDGARPSRGGARRDAAAAEAVG